MSRTETSGIPQPAFDQRLDWYLRRESAGETYSLLWTVWQGRRAVTSGIVYGNLMDLGAIAPSDTDPEVWAHAVEHADREWIGAAEKARLMREMAEDREHPNAGGW